MCWVAVETPIRTVGDDNVDDNVDADNFGTVTKRRDRIADLLELRARYAPPVSFAILSHSPRVPRAYDDSALPRQTREPRLFIETRYCCVRGVCLCVLHARARVPSPP